MNESKTIKDVVEEVEKSSTTFEKTNTDLKRKFLKWNIEAFNMIASSVSVNRGSFGNVCVETRFRSLFRIVPKVFILFGKDKDVYKKDEDV